MQVIVEKGRWPVKAWTDGVLFEDAARQQVANLAQMPFIHHHIAVMADVHGGTGATVGSVIPTIGAIIPAAVGVDIGCGVVAACTTLTAADLPESLHAMRIEIERAVPHGRSAHGGKGNPESFNSCSHGAGRAMSRTAARKQFTLADHIAATEGVECRKDIEVIDETPGAYKDIDAVMAAQADLVDVVHTLKAVLCVKG